MSTEIEVSQESQVADVLALSESMLQRERQEGVIDVLADPAQSKRFTNLRPKEYLLYAKILYEHRDIDVIAAWEDAQAQGISRDYVPPDMPRELVAPDWHLRVSLRGLLINVFRSIAHLVEGSGGGGKIGWFGRRK